MAVEKVEPEKMRIAASAELERVLRDHAQRRRQIRQEHQDPTIIYVGLVVVSILFGLSWWMLDRMRCDFFYSDIPFTSQRYKCR